MPILFRSCVSWAVLVAALGAPAAESNVEESRGPLARVVRPYVDDHVLAGAVMLVANVDRTLAVETVGFSDVAAGTPIQPDAMFWIASQSKAMTAAAVMMLTDEGKLSLDDPVEKYLPEFRGQMVVAERDAEHVLLRRPSHPITIRNVLAHTSGLPFRSPLEQPTLDGLRLRDAVRSYAMLPLEFEPDSKYQYSNAGINTAARVLEVASGTPYEEFIRKRLFDPLGMTDTTFWPNEEQIGRLAKSYRPNASKDGLEVAPLAQLILPLDDRRTRHPMPAGGLFSTAEDVARFCRMLLGDGEFEGKRILSAEAVKAMTSRQTAESLPQSYGLGLTVGEGTFGHGGAHATNMTVDRNRGLITIWMVQHAGFPGNGGESQGAFRRTAVERFAR